MPIFEYVCSECGHRFEKLVLSGRRAGEVRCPECASGSVDKAVSSFGLTSSSGGSASMASAANCSPAGG